MASAAGAISAQWNGAETGSSMARLMPRALEISTARSTAALWPEITTWPPPLSLAGCTTCFVSCLGVDHRLGADRLRLVEIGAEQGGHRTFARRHGALHGAAAKSEQLSGVRYGEAASRGERAVFAERMARHEGCGLGQEARRHRAR